MCFGEAKIFVGADVTLEMKNAGDIMAVPIGLQVGDCWECEVQ
jgi:hypothetical protein